MKGVGGKYRGEKLEMKEMMKIRHPVTILTAEGRVLVAMAVSQFLHTGHQAGKIQLSPCDQPNS